MKSEDFVEFENTVKYQDDKAWLFNVACIIFDQMRLVELKEEQEQINKRMFQGDRANYALEVPYLTDEEIHFAAA